MINIQPFITSKEISLLLFTMEVHLPENDTLFAYYPERDEHGTFWVPECNYGGTEFIPAFTLGEILKVAADHSLADISSLEEFAHELKEGLENGSLFVLDGIVYRKAKSE